MKGQGNPVGGCSIRMRNQEEKPLGEEQPPSIMAPTELVVRILNDEVETKRMPRTQTTQPQMDCYVMELQVT